MTAGLSFTPAALDELDESGQDYARVDPLLALAFLDEIERCIRWIIDNPRAAPVLRGSVRRKLASRFPYAVIYSLATDGIRVLAIAHLKRRPFYWSSRK